MNWDDLKIASAVEREGTFACAARMLGIDETTVARRLARLEKALGVRFFDAVDGVRRPTVRGAEILRLVAGMDQAAAKIENVAASVKGIVGRIRLSVTPALAEYFLAPHLDDFLYSNPGLVLALETVNSNADFSKWETDLAIRLGRPQKGHFNILKLGELRFCLLRPMHDAGFDQYLCVYPSELSSTPEMQALTRLHDLPPARLETANLRVIAQVVVNGRAMAVLPEQIAQSLLPNPSLAMEFLDIRREVWLLSQPHLRDDARARVVSEWIVHRFKESKRRRPV